MFPERQQPGAAAAGADGGGRPGHGDGGAGGAAGHAGARRGRALPQRHARRQVIALPDSSMLLSNPNFDPLFRCKAKLILHEGSCDASFTGVCNSSSRAGACGQDLGHNRDVARFPVCCTLFRPFVSLWCSESRWRAAYAGAMLHMLVP